MHRSVEEVLRRPQSVVDCVNLYVGMWVVVKVVDDVLLFYFFFQAEDGIRDLTVTGVQTCALPIYDRARRLAVEHRAEHRMILGQPLALLEPLEQVIERARTDAVKQAIVAPRQRGDRKSTRLNSSHSQISYAVFCLEKKHLLLTTPV